MKDFWKRKRNKRIAASALAVVMAGFLVWGLFPWQAAAAKNTVADDVTINKWHETLDDSTKNVGRIWTDKSVSTGNVTLSNKVGESAKESATIEKGSESDFLVGLSALSSTAKIMGQTTVPLDIVLVLDVSGSMDDRDKDGVKKINKLKGAVNNFIDTTADKNNALSDTNKRSRISLVKFAGDKTNVVGDHTYKDGGYTYNYTQIVSGYKAYTRTNKAEIKSKVNALEPAGATSADYGMAHAQALVNQSKADETANTDRKNVKRIVIFFTDGEPNHNSGFDGDVADDAINAAKSIKEDASIYTIGVFNDADANITGSTGLWWTNKEKFNAYMHGMSSNYPNATAYYNLGTRAPDSNFYKAAKAASTLNTIFDAIAEEIVSSAQSPTQMNQGELPNQGGYITFTDQLGDYMQVDDMNALVYANTIYTDKEKQESSDKSTITYIYEKQITDTNHVYPEGNLKDIKITVKKSDDLQTGDLVTVMIPANMIPLRYYEVSKGKMTISETYPMRLFYDVSLKADAEKKIENPDAAMQAYINANKNDDGQVQFYSNKYEAEANDKPETIGAYSHFVPATTNDFYYFQEDAPLYTDKECTKAATSIDTTGGTTYYYQRDYYELGEGDKAEKKTNTVTIPGNSNILLEGYAVKDVKTGQYYIPAGTPRTTSLTYFTENKTDVANKTGTASTFIKPTWDYDNVGSGITTYLGNNGKMTFDLPGELDITKAVTAAEGHAVPDSLKNQEFTYTLELTAKEGSQLKEKYTAQKYTGAEAEGKEFDIKSGDTFTLKDRQTLKIYGLESGTTYTVTETKAAHFTGTAVQNNAGDNPVVKIAENGNVTATGTITGNQQTFANYTNTYKASFAYETTGGLLVEKVLNGRTMQAGEFNFTITPQDGAPGVSEADASFNNPQQRASGVPDSMQKLLGLTFTQNDAGKTYKYIVKETSGSAAGVTYDTTRFLVAIQVMDNGDGTMYAITTITPQNADGNQSGQPVTYNSSQSNEKPSLRFTNTYEAGAADPVDITTGFNKVLKGRSWNDNDSFTFTIANTQKPEGVEVAPMPNKTTVTVKKADVNAGKAPVDFGSITFAKAGVYKYTVTETAPEPAGAGMVYDTAPRTITVTVTDDGSGKLKAAVTSVEGSKTFTNEYKTADLPLDTACSVRVTKVLNGHDMAKDQFEFSIKAKDKDSAEKLRIDENNGATFGSAAAADGEVVTLLDSLNMTLTQSDIGKTYSYTFAETKGNAAGYTYDENQYKLEITTHDAGDGTLTAIVVLTNTKTGTEVFNKTVSATDPALGEKGITIPFVNRYDGSTDVSGGTKATISADKTLNGRNLKDGEFTFTLATRPTTGNGTVLQTKTNNADGTIPFDALSYRTSVNAAGNGVILSEAVQAGYAVKSTNNDGKTVYTLSYSVSETKGNLGGVSYTDTFFDFNVIVTDNGDGTLKAETQYPKDKNKFEFINTYSTGEPIPMDIKGSKTLDYAEGLTPDDIAGKFTFTITALTDGAPMPENTTAKNDAAGNVDFGNITFDLDLLKNVPPAVDGSRSKTFEYKVIESGSAAGVTNDTDKTKTFKIILKDDGNGQLTATCDPKEGPKFTFTNTYSVEELPSSITDQINIDKDLTGRDLKKGEFTFELLENGDVVATGSNDASGNVTFEKITYTQPGHHTYTVREVNNDLGGVTYDDQAYTVYTQIIDQGNGKLKAEHQAVVQMDNEFAPIEGNEITFTNKYEAKGTMASIGAVKRLTGKDLKDGQFTFQLKDENGKVIDEAKNDKAGAISFKALEFDKAGTYKYTISEVNDKQKEIKYDTSEKTVTITVKDSGDGYLQAQVESEKQLIFTNTFEAAGGSGTKTGDNMNLVLPIMMMLTAAAIGSVLLIRRKYHR